MQFMYTNRATTFTTFGRAVHLHVLGESNCVQWIGGIRLLSLSTSAAAPETARVAAQMLAVARSALPGCGGRGERSGQGAGRRPRGLPITLDKLL